MATSNPVKVLEVCTVTPTPPTSTTSLDSTAQMSLPLTFFDILFFRLPPTQRLFFYQTSHSKTTFIDTVLPRLKHSLSITLQHYLPLAGNLIWPEDSNKPILQYLQGNAVSLTIAESSEANFYHLSSNNFREAKELNLYVPNLLASDARAPVMSLQVTLFPNTGFSIGYAAHHAVLDGKTVAMFMHSWASICRQGEEEFSTLKPELTPLYDRASIKDPANLETNYLHGWSEKIGHNTKSLEILSMEAPPDVMLGTFQLTKANIENLKKWVQAQWEKKHKRIAPIHVSTFTIASAYIWVCLVKARELSADQKVHLAINVDCRARLEPPIPSTYFGNCVAAFILDADLDELIAEDGVARAAKVIGEAIGGLNKEVPKEAEDVMSKFCSISLDRLFSMAGSPRFELYHTDFGWGRPKKVEMISIVKTGAICLSDSSDGIEIGVVLKKHQIEAFASLFASGLGSN